MFIQNHDTQKEILILTSLPVNVRERLDGSQGATDGNDTYGYENGIANEDEEEMDGDSNVSSDNMYSDEESDDDMDEERQGLQIEAYHQ